MPTPNGRAKCETPAANRIDHVQASQPFRVEYDNHHSLYSADECTYTSSSSFLFFIKRRVIDPNRTPVTEARRQNVLPLKFFPP